MNDTATLAALESRLAKLERLNRLLVACLAAAAGITVFTAAKTASQSVAFSEVRAHRFVLLDDRGLRIGVWHSDAGGFPNFEMGKRAVPRPIILKDGTGGPSFRISNPNGSSIQLQSLSSACSLHMTARSSVGGNRHEQVHLFAGNSSALSISRPNQSWFSISPGTSTPFLLRGPQNRDIWALKKGILNLNGVPLSLNDYNGAPILTLPGQSLPRTTDTPKKPFPLFGPRR